MRRTREEGPPMGRVACYGCGYQYTASIHIPRWHRMVNWLVDIGHAEHGDIENNKSISLFLLSATQTWRFKHCLFLSIREEGCRRTLIIFHNSMGGWNHMTHVLYSYRHVTCCWGCLSLVSIPCYLLSATRHRGLSRVITFWCHRTIL